MRNLTSGVALSFSLLAIASTAYGQDSLPPLPGHFTARSTVLPYTGGKSVEELTQLAPPVASIPYWSSSIKVGTTTYNYMMVGGKPTVKLANPVSKIKVVIVPVKFVFKSGATVVATFDPTKVDATCSPKGSAVTMVKNSPILGNVKKFKVGGTSLGTGQYVSLFQRGEFYNDTKPNGLNPGYQVELTPVVTFGTQTVNVSNGNVFSVTCGKLGLYDIAAFDSLIQNTYMPKLAAAGYGPDTLPLFLTYNVVLDQNNDPNNCCILGYHSAFNNPSFGNAFQTYSVADYDSSQAFNGTSDVSALSHEIAEWMNDPNTSNPTPPWGHIGQVSGCQANLEVGDPLSGTIKPIALNGFTYHVQDLAFLSWFYQQKTSIGVNGWYSLYGTFKVKAKPCA
jgi:hypothetical protein